ncbi:hypothetical protein LCGC14_2634640 [marine sediment metagenome]|uniref:PRTRC system protein E n=1 Tax=marine sediment metagenome TaxID=412755 RepID=A0A0F8ZZF7_9ZZZZ
MLNLLQQLSVAINNAGHKVSFDFSCVQKNVYRLVVQADVGITPSNASDEEVFLRTAIATPFLLTGSVNEIAADFNNRLASHFAAVDSAKAQLGAINEAIHKASSSKSTKSPVKVDATTGEDDTDSAGDDADSSTATQDQAVSAAPDIFSSSPTTPQSF